MNVCGQHSEWKTETGFWIYDCGRAPITEDGTFILHPNPANDYVTVSLIKDISEESDIAEHGQQGT